MNMERIVSNEKERMDEGEFSLRPQRLSEYIGQRQLKDNLRVFIDAAKQRNEALDHVLEVCEAPSWREMSAGTGKDDAVVHPGQ